jgi:undecaprenyl-diphosphatase
VTEFLPVSSSGHLALAQMLIPGFQQRGVVFDAMLHVGTACAVVWFERRQIARWLGSAGGRKPLALILLGTVATSVIALPLRASATAAFARPLWVGLALMLTGCVVGATKWLPGGSLGERDTGWRQAVSIGLAQGLAVFPGLSRSAVTIATGLSNRMERAWAARYSFLLAVPAILLATLVETAIAWEDPGRTAAKFWLACLLGAITAGITGYFAMQVVITTVSSRVFHRFSWYCFVLGGLAIAWGLG